jgi:hypothetical protein
MSEQEERFLWVVRTDFTNDQVWTEIKRLVSAPQVEPISGLEFRANVRFVEEAAFANLTSGAVVQALPDEYPGFVVFVADSETGKSKEKTLQVIGFTPQGDDPKAFERKPRQTPSSEIRVFRAVPATVQSIENNLSLGNMDFENFAGAVESDEIFRGFKSS